MTDVPKFRIGLLLFPNLTQLDLTGPAEVFARMPGAEIFLIWKSLEPVRADRGLTILPTHTFLDCPQLDVICVPGGPGQVALMEDDATLQFIKKIAEKCTLITSVCTGSLILGAAGLLKGYRATSHWSSVDQLRLLGAEPVMERVVIDRNRVTGAGVTSGIDFALRIVAQLTSPDTAKIIQLQLEYDPEPPYHAGSPKTASPETMKEARERIAPFIAERLSATERAARRLK